MNYKDAMNYCLSLPGTQRQIEMSNKQIFSLSVNNTVFGLFETGAPIQWKFSVQVAPEKLKSLLNPPMVKVAEVDSEGCWITIVRLENFDGDQLKRLIDWSYQQAQNPVQFGSTPDC